MIVATFEGQDVRRIEMGITGRAATRQTAHHIGDEVTLLVVGYVSKVAHADKDGALVRTHTLKVAEAHELDEGEAGELLIEARTRDKRELDALLGREPLFDDIDPDTGEIK